MKSYTSTKTTTSFFFQRRWRGRCENLKLRRSSSGKRWKWDPRVWRGWLASCHSPLKRRRSRSQSNTNKHRVFVMFRLDRVALNQHGVAVKTVQIQYFITFFTLEYFNMSRSSVVFSEFSYGSCLIIIYRSVPSPQIIWWSSKFAKITQLYWQYHCKKWVQMRIKFALHSSSKVCVSCCLCGYCADLPRLLPGLEWH